MLAFFRFNNFLVLLMLFLVAGACSPSSPSKPPETFLEKGLHYESPRGEQKAGITVKQLFHGFDPSKHDGFSWQKRSGSSWQYTVNSGNQYRKYVFVEKQNPSRVVLTEIGKRGYDLPPPALSTMASTLVKRAKERLSE